MREAVSRIRAEWPAAPLCLYSLSAGTGLMVRYLGEEGSRAPICAAVANCPGYDIGVCLQRCNPLYDAGFYISVLKKHWLGGENGRVLRQASPELCARMAAAPDMHSFMVAAAYLHRAPNREHSSPLCRMPRIVLRGGRPFALPNALLPREANTAAGGTRASDAGTVANSFATYLERSNPMGVAHRIAVPSLSSLA